MRLLGVLAERHAALYREGHLPGHEMQGDRSLVSLTMVGCSYHYSAGLTQEGQRDRP